MEQNAQAGGDPLAMWFTPIVRDVEAQLTPFRERLMSHPMYSAIQTVEDVQCFMESHVFAGWDFMALLKAAQQTLTCVRTAWVPSEDAQSRRLINEIVLDEESDVLWGRPMSHFEAYIEAMDEAKADSSRVLRFVSLLDSGKSVAAALRTGVVPLHVTRFVSGTWDTIQNRPVHEVAASLAFGREDIIPEMFSAIIEDLNQQFPGRFDKLKAYLDRHITLDADEHRDKIVELVARLCGREQSKWDAVASVAKASIEARITLWDSVLVQLRERQG